MNMAIKENNENDKVQEGEIQRENSFSNVGNQTLDSIVSMSQSHSAKNKSLMSSLIVMLKKPFDHKNKKQSKSKKNKKPIISQSSLHHTPSHIIVQDNSVLHHSFSKASNIKSNTDNFIMDLQSDVNIAHTTSEHQLKPKISLEIKQKKSHKKDQRKSKKSHLYQKFNVKKIFKKKKPTVFSSVVIIDAEPLPVKQDNINDNVKLASTKLSTKIDMTNPEQKVDTTNSHSTNVQSSNMADAVIESIANEEEHKNEIDISGVCASQNKISSFGNISELPVVSGIDPTDSLPTLVEGNSLSSSTTPTKDDIVKLNSLINENGVGEEHIVPETKIEEGKLNNDEKMNSNKHPSFKVLQDTISSHSSSVPELSSEPNNSIMQVDLPYQSSQPDQLGQTEQPTKPVHPAEDDVNQLFENSQMSRTPTPTLMDSIEPTATSTNDQMNPVIINTSTTTEDYLEDDIRIYCGLPDRTLETAQSVVEKVSQYFADNIACFWSIFPLNEQHQRMGNWKLGEFIDRWFRSGYEECVKEISSMISTQDQFLIERLLKFQLKSCSWTSHNNFLQYNLIRLCMEKDDEQHINILLRYFILPPHLWSRIAYFIAELLEFASGIYPDYDVIVSELTDSYDLVHRMNPIQLCLTAIYMGTNIVPKRKRPTIFRSSINEELYDHEYTLLELMCCLVVESCMKKYCETEIIKYLMQVYAPIVLSLADSNLYTMNLGESQELSTSLIPNYTNTGRFDTDESNRLGNSDSLQFNLNLMKQHLYQSDPSTIDISNNLSANKIDPNDSTLNKNNDITNTNNNHINANDSNDINISAVDQSHNLSNNLYYNNPYYNQNTTMNQTQSTYESSGNPIGIPMYLLHEQNSFDISNHCIDMDEQSVPGDDNSTYTHPSLVPKGKEFEMETISYQANDLLSKSISTTSLTQSSIPSDSKMDHYNKEVVNFYLQKRNEPIVSRQSVVETNKQKASLVKEEKKYTDSESDIQKTPVVEVGKEILNSELDNLKTPMDEIEKEMTDMESDDMKTPVVEVEKKTPDSESDDLMTPTVINSGINSEKDVNDDYVSFKKLENLIPEKIQPIVNTNNSIVTVATPATVELLNESVVQDINVSKAIKGKGELQRTTCQNDVNDYKIKKEGNSMEIADNGKLLMVEPLELVELDKLTMATENLTLNEKVDELEKIKDSKDHSIQSKKVDDDEGERDNDEDGNPDISTSFSERHSFRIKDSLSLSSEYSGLRRCTQSINTINSSSLTSSHHSHYSRQTLSRNDSEDQLHQYLSRHSIGLYEDMEEVNGGTESDFDRNTNYTSLGFINGSNRTPSEAISSFDLSSHCPSFYSYSLRAGSKGKKPMSITASLSSSSSTSSYDEDGVNHDYSFVSMLSSKPSLSMKSILDSTNSKVVLHEFGSTHTNSHRNIPRAQGGMVGSISSQQDFHPGQSSSSHLQSMEKSQVVKPSISSLYLGDRQTIYDSLPSTSRPQESSNTKGSTSNDLKVPPERTSSLNPNLDNPSTSVAATANTTDPLQNQTFNTISTSILMGAESPILDILRSNNRKVNRQIRMEALHSTIHRVNPHLSEKWVKALELFDDYQHHPSLKDTFTDYTMGHLNELEAILRIYHIFNMNELQNDIMRWVDSLIAKD